MNFDKQSIAENVSALQMSEGEGASMAPPAFSLNEQPTQLKTNPHGNACDCSNCLQFLTEDAEKQAQPLPDDTMGPVQRATGDGEKEAETDTDTIEPTYTGKEFEIVAGGATILDQGKDSNDVPAYNAAQKEIAQNYAVTKVVIPKNSKVKLVETATSHDKGKNKEVAKVEVISVPDGAAASHVGQTYWTTRTNVSAEADDKGEYTVTDGQANVRSGPEAIMGFDKIPAGTKVSITDTKGIDEFPESFRLSNNSDRNSFHNDRYMRLYLLASWTTSDGVAHSGWIKATDVVGGFTNEVLGVSEVPAGSLESSDPSHMTVGTATANLLKKGALDYSSPKIVDSSKVYIAQGTFVQILATSADGKYVKVSNEDNSVSGEWTSKGNLDMSKKKQVGEGEASVTFYEVTDSEALVRLEKQGFESTGTKLNRGDFVKVHSTEGEYGLISKVGGTKDNRVVEAEQHYINMAELAPGWSTDLKGANASWGKVIIGGKEVSKYKGQDELVNLGGSAGKMKQVSKEAYPNLMKMINAALGNTKADGSADKINIEINSCFRTYFSQKYFDDNENKPGFNTAASPGWSAHQDSNAFDLNNLKDSAVYTWLKNNAWKFDIVQNVKASNERHHWAYIPGAGKEGYYTTWNTPANKSWL